MAIITEDYVSFEVAKLLKEKGFDWECIGYYVDDEPDDVKYSFCGETNSTWESRCCSAPTLQTAMKWLREVHKLHIDILPNPIEFKDKVIQDGWGCEVTHLSNLTYECNYRFSQKKYKTYEEASESAIKYCLENLI